MRDAIDPRGKALFGVEALDFRVCLYKNILHEILDIVAAKQEFSCISSKFRLITEHQSPEDFSMALLYLACDVFVGLFQCSLYDS